MNSRHMSNGVFRFEENKALMKLKDDLRDSLGDSLVGLILFGSRARGDYDSASDIDIAIIVQGLSRKLKNQILNNVAEIELRYLVPISTLVLSEEDFNHLRKRERRIALDIEREGMPL